MKKLYFLIVLLLNTNFLCAQDPNNTRDNTITICWDTSLSMLERDIEKEFEVLERIFKTSPNVEVQLLRFNITVEEEHFTISNGNWSKLKSSLVQAMADGATTFDGLEENIKNEQVYFFTDGNALSIKELLPIKKGNIIINSLVNRNEEALKKAALIGRGRLMDFAAMLPGNLGSEGNTQNSKILKTISGIVYIDNEPHKDIEVRVKGSDKIYKTDDSGKFIIPSIPGDSILVSSRIFKTMKTIPVGYFTQEVDIFMDSNVTALDEVVVTEKRLDAASKDMVNTGNGVKDKESIGFAVQSIGEEDITPIQTDLNQSIQGKFSNVTLGSDQDLTQFKGRSNNTLLGNNYGLVVVDGVPIQQSDSSTGFMGDASFINPDNVADITVLKGFAATNRYGTAGNGGVILITTKTAMAGKENSDAVSSALVQNNIYDSNSELTETKSALTKTLEGTGSLEKAYEKYLTLRNFNEDNVAFYLNAFTYFKDRDKKIATRIISNLWEKNPEKQEYIKIVELSARYAGDYRIADLANNKLNNSKPTAIQPFFTEAKLQLDQDQYQEALTSFSALEKGGSYGTMNVQPINKPLERELKNLLFQKKGSLDVTNVKEAYFKNTQMNVRLLVEWSNSKSEFEIQFVNPQNRFFNWEHTTSANQNRIQEEVNLGYSMEEFELYDDLKGNWQINVNYLGNLDKNNFEPLVVLCSMYTNFGFPSQTKELIWLYLDSQNPRKKLVKFKI